MGRADLRERNREYFDVVIVGAGASGLAASSQIRNGKVAILEGNPKIGAKIGVSGGGKCNITNREMSPEHFEGDPLFVAEILSRFDEKELLRFLKERGVEAIFRPSTVPGQYFLRSSQELIDLLRRETSRHTLFSGERLLSVDRPTSAPFLLTTDRRTLTADRLLLATGAPSYPQLGATEIGHTVARRFGHTVTPLDPALTGLTLQPAERPLTGLAGLSTEAEITVGTKQLRGGLLFAHRGLTGPVIFNTSLWWRRGPIAVNWLPTLTDADFDRLLRNGGNKTVSTLLPLPKRLARTLLDLFVLPDLPLSRLTVEERSRLARIRAHTFSPSGRFGYSRAEVTRGGVSLSEVDPATLESRLAPRLYFAGELLDVTGELGGYNLQWAFSSGIAAGRAIDASLSRLR